MSKNNVELYFNEKISDQEKLIELKDPSFTKPDFVKPNIDSIKIDNKDKNADIKKLDFDINHPLDKIPVEQMKPTNVGITYLKKVYDGLIDSINEYNTSLSSNITTGIVEPLSTTISNIGNNTTEIKVNFKLFEMSFRNFVMISQALQKLPYSLMLLAKRTGCFNKKGNSLLAVTLSTYHFNVAELILKV